MSRRPPASAWRHSAAPLLVLAIGAGCAADPGLEPKPVPGEPAAPPVAAPSPATGVPDAFQGRYAADAGACARPGDPSHLDIGRDRIAFHESSGPVLHAAAGPGGLAVTARLTGEGETREATYRFGLAGDGGVLTDLEGGMARIRCD